MNWVLRYELQSFNIVAFKALTRIFKYEIKEPQFALNT